MVKNTALRVLGVINIILSVFNGIYVYISNNVNIERLETVIEGNSAIKASAQQALDTLNLFIILCFVGLAIGLIVGILAIIQANKALCVASSAIYTLFALAVSIMSIINQFFFGIVVIFIISLIMMILSIKAQKN
ncbi:MAG: hypothetical protein UHK60_01175 [Acutalibacteraceae bacterium]|nr:hypothetical protein [Acutalibacteraceae bacterium]